MRINLIHLKQTNKYHQRLHAMQPQFHILQLAAAEEKGTTSMPNKIGHDLDFVKECQSRQVFVHSFV